MTIFKRAPYQPATPAEYGVGKHYAWEVEAHKEAERVFKETGSKWDYNQRVRWVDTWLVTHSYYDAMSIEECPVCSTAITEALLRGEKPFAIPNVVRAELKKLAARISLREWRLQKATLDD